MKKLFLFILILTTSSAFARIGETLDECQARYGPMINTDMSRSDFPAYVFRKDGIEIRVRLNNGKSAQEIFFGIKGELSLLQDQQILSANLGSEQKAHYERFNPRLDSQRIRALGVKVAAVSSQVRQRYGITLEKATSSDTTILERSLRHFDVDLDPHPLGINGEDGYGDVLVITTAEFDRALNGTSGF